MEDHIHVREMIIRTLSQAGFQMETAVERREIFNLLLAGNIAAIILDLSLPGDDGVSIAKAARLGTTKRPNWLSLTKLLSEPFPALNKTRHFAEKNWFRYKIPLDNVATKFLYGIPVCLRLNPFRNETSAEAPS